MDTILKDKIRVNKKRIDPLLFEMISYMVKQYITEFDELFLETDDVYTFDIYDCYIRNRNVVLDLGENIAFPDFSGMQKEMIHVNEAGDYINDIELIPGIKSDIIHFNELKKIQKRVYEGFGPEHWIICRTAGEIKSCSLTKSYCASGGNGFIFPIARFDKIPQSDMDLLVNYLVRYDLVPDRFSKNAENKFKDLELLLGSESRYVVYNGTDLVFNAEKMAEDLLDNPSNPIFMNLHWSISDVLKEYYTSGCWKEGVTMEWKKKLLNCEKVRADIEPYEEKILTDPNRGHWDLWSDEEGDNGDTCTVLFKEQYVARNPQCDINEDGVIAIDFGTKSTVVVYQGSIEHSLPMGIGDGNLSKGDPAKRYENPTVMWFVNAERFMAAYQESAGRPDTQWEDLPVSHTAMDKFQNSKSEHYYSFLYQIKQWAGLREKQFRIQPIEGESFLLPPFLELKENDINPIELYAYYIGLYINNMRKGHGIFLDYYLSFPVTYETEIRKKIIEAFEKGLKKSLPVSILKNENIMKRFRVNGDISEPMAYAVCALQEYGLEPDEDEEIYYGIFDFGGGTTDFDFGLWRNSSKRRYDYTIESFGAGGDKYLGGENLLEMLSFEIFKLNQKLMRENNYFFSLPPEGKEFLGSDAVLSDSQEAEKNMHNLMEKLRPYWEKSIEKNDDETDERKNDKREADQGFIRVGLFNKDGVLYPNVELKADSEMIEQFFEDKIRNGVKNFFSALMLSYQNDKGKRPQKVHILLAGNSCKSPLVRKVFEEEIALQSKEIKEKMELKDSDDQFFEIFPPLGTKEAYEKMDERNIPYSENDSEKPTGKTGVAFGLLQCREGGTIERISSVNLRSEIPFQYFLGWNKRRKFRIFKDEEKITKYVGKPDYNEWYRFIEADAPTFYIYYTTLPECVNGNLLIDGNAAVRRLKCDIDVVDENAFVYIRALTPHSIQYVVSKERDVEKGKMGEMHTKELD